jgi:methylenetetrahydrofolate reductase (NADPH)
VYVSHTPKASPDDIVRVALRIQALGLTASPHIVARRVVDPQRLRERLQALVAGGVEQALLVAGDLATPTGPFTSTLELLDSGVLRDVGIKRLGVAGHPEGHPSPMILWQALSERATAGAGLQMHITLTGFDTAPYDL